MDWSQITVLALVQGLTEFLPISSSAHLILVPRLTGWPDQGLSFDIAVHTGTLVAVLGYFRHELVAMVGAWGRSLYDRRQSDASRLAWQVIVATVPVGVAGVLLKDSAETMLRSPLVIAAATLGFGLLLGFADLRARGERNEYALAWTCVLAIGLAQVLALIPGTSRSGITMTAALLLGVSRSGAARFSFLLSIPVILAAGLFNVLDLAEQDAADVDARALMLGAVVSAVTAYLCIHFFLQLIERVGMMPFVVYRVLLGIVLLGIFL